MALAYFETSLLELDILNLLAWEDDYSEFVEELKLYFGSLDLIGESESKIKNLTMKSSQRIAKYIVEFNRLATITGHRESRTQDKAFDARIRFQGNGATINF